LAQGHLGHLQWDVPPAVATDAVVASALFLDPLAVDEAQQGKVTPPPPGVEAASADLFWFALAPGIEGGHGMVRVLTVAA
jgi:hypothetical protein